jgi:hypothetical protein
MLPIFKNTSLAPSAQSQPVQNGTETDINRGNQSVSGPVTRSAAVVVAVTLQRLVEDATRFWSIEEQLVLDALRRSKASLNGASVEELSSYVSSLTPEQLRGVASNVKGIYHELLFVHFENADGDEVTAQIFEATNHPGADVEFIVAGETIREVQLKAVTSLAQIREHLSRYPHIDVVATSEVAATLPNVTSSGFSNADLKANLASTFDELPGDSLFREIGEGVSASALVSGAIVAGRILRGRPVSRKELSATLGDVAVGGIAAVVLDAILDGIT